MTSSSRWQLFAGNDNETLSVAMGISSDDSSLVAIATVRPSFRTGRAIEHDYDNDNYSVLGAIRLLLSHHLKTACWSSADLRVVFAFFSNRLGCIGSLIVSVLGSLVLILVLRGCGAF